MFSLKHFSRCFSTSSKDCSPIATPNEKAICSKKSSGFSKSKLLNGFEPTTIPRICASSWFILDTKTFLLLKLNSLISLYNICMPKLLDLFSGQGGASMGYERAGFDVIVGVDTDPAMLARYPHERILADALTYDWEPGEYDLIHASPPCQRWSDASPNKKIHPDLLRPIKKKLEAQDTPYVIENVEAAPLKSTIKLCGTIFPSLRVLRHRVFATSFHIPQPPLPYCSNHPPVYSTDKRRKENGLDEWKDYVSVYGGNHASIAACKDAMGISWMSRRGLSQSIPPEYTKLIGSYFIQNYT